MSDGKVRLIAGLGNPGPKYAGTRHNVGFEVLELFASQSSSASPWKVRDGAELCELKHEGESLFLVKPLKFMNLSGQPLQALMSYFKITPAELVVCHDDLDLPLGSLRLKFGGGDGGHNGIRSISESLSSKDYVRVKVGIGRPINTESEDAVSNYVLNKFSKEERVVFEGSLKQSVLALEALLAKGLKQAQNLYNC